MHRTEQLRITVKSYRKVDVARQRLVDGAIPYLPNNTVYDDVTSLRTLACDGLGLTVKRLPPVEPD